MYFLHFEFLSFLSFSYRLVNYTGNYDMFIKTKAELEVNQMKKYQKEQEDIKHLKGMRPTNTIENSHLSTTDI